MWKTHYFLTMRFPHRFVCLPHRYHPFFEMIEEFFFSLLRYLVGLRPTRCRITGKIWQNDHFVMSKHPFLGSIPWARHGETPGLRSTVGHRSRGLEDGGLGPRMDQKFFFNIGKHYAGCWFGTNWLIFFRGVETTNQLWKMMIHPEFCWSILRQFGTSCNTVLQRQRSVDCCPTLAVGTGLGLELSELSSLWLWKITVRQYYPRTLVHVYV